MEEIWKDVQGYEGYYQVSNLGRVKSLKRHAPYDTKYGKRAKYVNEKILAETEAHNGYSRVHLRTETTNMNKLIHRLVAETFIPNPLNKPQINHIDGNKKNNCVSNLEWATQSENMQHAFRTGLCDIEKMKIKCKLGSAKYAKPIIAYKDGEIFKEFFSKGDACKYFNKDHKTIDKLIRQQKTINGLLLVNKKVEN